MAQPPNVRFVLESRVDSLVANELRNPVSTTRLELMPIVSSEAAAAATNALASDGTVAAAAASAADEAVDANIAGKSLVLTTDNRLAQVAIDDGYVKGWADSNDKLALGIKSDGTAHAPVLESGLVNGIKVETLNELVTGMLHALVDSEGRMAEPFAVATDGRFPQWVVDSLASRMSIPAPAPGVTALLPAHAVLPANIYFVAGELVTLYHENIIRNKRADQWVRLSGSTGYFADRWQLTPSAGTVTLTYQIMNADNTVAETKAISVQTTAKPAANTVRLLPIGDSITGNTNYFKTAMTQLSGKAVGTRTTDDGVTGHEGRGGWSLDSYFTRVGRTDGIDSPFMFPVGVAGAKYRGNTAFWKAVFFTDPTGYLTNGYQKVGSGWTDSTPDFDANGYPIAPTTGDVVFDPTKAAGSQFQEYSGSAWAARGVQPAWEFNYSKYMDRYSFVFAAVGLPTVVSIMLGTNDFGSTTVTDQKLADYKTKMDTLIASIRTYSATLPIVLMTPPTGGHQDRWEAKPYGETHVKEFDDKMKAFADYIIATYGTATANKVFLAIATGAVALANHADWVHPDTAGHTQLAPWLSGAIAKAVGA